MSEFDMNGAGVNRWGVIVTKEKFDVMGRVHYRADDSDEHGSFDGVVALNSNLPQIRATGEELGDNEVRVRVSAIDSYVNAEVNPGPVLTFMHEVDLVMNQIG